jgi:hypothetical protein
MIANSRRWRRIIPASSLPLPIAAGEDDGFRPPDDAGGIGGVRKARAIGLDRIVAIKTIGGRSASASSVRSAIAVDSRRLRGA